MIQEMFRGGSRRRRGGFRRPAQPLQHGGPVRLVVAVRPHRPEARPTPSSSRSGTVLYVTIPYAGRIGSVALFVAASALILTMYGGGFATIPAYLSDMFGTQYVGAIHGRLLTAWSAAGVARAGTGQLHPGVPDRTRSSHRPGL